MLEKTSFIGISSIYQYIEGQTPTPTPGTTHTLHLEGRVISTAMSMSGSKTCYATIELPTTRPNLLRLPPGSEIFLTAPIESCNIINIIDIPNPTNL
jgi:hypothetical protein